ncbi:MAG: hypothetical protein WC325_10600 [Candidatus Bathyarchaeia archaeon]
MSKYRTLLFSGFIIVISVSITIWAITNELASQNIQPSPPATETPSYEPEKQYIDNHLEPEWAPIYIYSLNQLRYGEYSSVTIKLYAANGTETQPITFYLGDQNGKQIKNVTLNYQETQNWNLKLDPLNQTDCTEKSHYTIMIKYTNINQIDLDNPLVNEIFPDAYYRIVITSYPYRG